jgi:hypothetical protein
MLRRRLFLIFFALSIFSNVRHVEAVIAGPADNNIRATVHNMSNNTFGYNLSRFVYSNNEDQVCIFCHTPHSAGEAKPLWNKVLPTQTFDMYTSSRSLTSTARGVKSPGPESLLCLSCHDGLTAMNVVHSSRNPSSQSVETGEYSGYYKIDLGGGGFDFYDDGQISQGISYGWMGFNSPANIGKRGGTGDVLELEDAMYGRNLTDDHPISFSYTAAYEEKVQNGSYSLRTVNEAKERGARFFGGNNRIECSSCHNPHVAYGSSRMGETGVGNPALDPFLVRDNDGSALCLACHNK